jgi:hypothetical protein
MYPGYLVIATSALGVAAARKLSVSGAGLAAPLRQRAASAAPPCSCRAGSSLLRVHGAWHMDLACLSTASPAPANHGHRGS